MKAQCAAWDGKQCKVTTNLTNCVMRVQQGTVLKGPVSVVVKLCTKHFQLDIPAKEHGDGDR